ncbi:tetratricopeptide repeat protein [Flaviaesturariibacter aridisoli]|uniref:Tetratricopeptide repeat protein n=1 Tax=Flaviaesturariibacter aridisoli TaxID=2545761 RepID=A0A4R4E0Z2_9BACT|nr:tetratricopeptide repeat protein [Flaviaesturariibacter aridisoli]TCZ73104.1 tetratricopeptide repeat protein [Flaviaesturariibacter aridisoli]
MKALLLLLALAVGAVANGQQEAIRAGNEAYRNADWTFAENQYRQAGNHPVAQYNLANALIRQNRYDEALAVLSPLTAPGNNASLRSKAWYNMGVVYTRQKALEQSIEAYKSALRIAPYDKEARENLQKALLELKQNSGGGGASNDKNKNNDVDRKLKELQDKERKLQQSKKDKGGGNQPNKDW